MSVSPRRKAIDWPAAIAEARLIVDGYGAIRPTLRKLHYRLVTSPRIEYPNDLTAYNELARRTAKARREGNFPRLKDGAGRRVDRPFGHQDLASATEWFSNSYRLDRTAGQPYLVYLGIEKGTYLDYLRFWFQDQGVPVVAFKGYSGEELVTDVAQELRFDSDNRERVFIFASDFDPSGLDLERDFLKRLEAHGQRFDHVIRVALNPEDIAGLPESIDPMKEGDTRKRAFQEFCRGHGVEPCQVELEALDDAVLRQRYRDALTQWWDPAAHQAVLDQEAEDIRLIQRRAS